MIFAQPVARMHAVLPPPRSDIEDCLLVLFVGRVLPVEVDYKPRTPLVVRRNVVLATLHWLVLNHEDYIDVAISQIGESYPSGSEHPHV